MAAIFHYAGCRWSLGCTRHSRFNYKHCLKYKSIAKQQADDLLIIQVLTFCYELLSNVVITSSPSWPELTATSIRMKTINPVFYLIASKLVLKIKSPKIEQDNIIRRWWRRWRCQLATSVTNFEIGAAWEVVHAVSMQMSHHGNHYSNLTSSTSRPIERQL